MSSRGWRRPASGGARCSRGMADVDFSRTMPDPRFGESVSVWWIIVRGNLDHEIHHRGQIAAYLRALRLSERDVR